MANENMTFREAYGVLQQHAETLRNQTEPNIDDLLPMVEESVTAYRICKERIDAVEKALEKALTDVATDAAPRSGAEDGPARAALPARTTKSAPAAPAPAAKGGNDDMDDDIPF
jgi:exodeoxyribonuclease VII small subunit